MKKISLMGVSHFRVMTIFGGAMFKKKEKYTKESLLKLLVEQQTKIEEQEEKIKMLEHHIEIMDRLSRSAMNHLELGEKNE